MPCLPYENDDVELEHRFALYTQQRELGPALAYKEAHSEVRRTKEGMEGVFAFDPDTALWRELSLAVWELEVAQWCRGQLNVLIADVDAQRRKCVDPDQPGSKVRTGVWMAAMKRAAATLEHVGRVAGVHAVTKWTHSLLLSPGFFASLDAARGVLSVSNGVVDLRTGELRPRTRDDCLSYALPMAYDPAADTSDIQTAVSLLFEDAAVERRFQAMCGYWATGSTRLKEFYQFYGPTYSGKTVILKAVCAALGKYAVMGEVPIGELEAGTSFETTIGKRLQAFPPPRVVVFDELNQRTTLNEEFINQASSGLADIRLACRMKGTSAFTPGVIHAKWVFSLNHPLCMSASSTGTAARMTGPPFRLHFVDPATYDPLTSPPHARPRDTGLALRLESPDARQGVLTWIVAGARIFYDEGGGMALPQNDRWDAHAFHLRSQGDDFIAWLARVYFPSGNPQDRIAFSRLHDAFAADNKHVRGNTQEGLRAALSTMEDYVAPIKWAESEPVYNPGPFAPPPAQVEVVGVGGLRRRAPGDPEWRDAMVAARDALRQARRAAEDGE